MLSVKSSYIKPTFHQRICCTNFRATCFENVSSEKPFTGFVCQNLLKDNYVRKGK